MRRGELLLSWAVAAAVRGHDFGNNVTAFADGLQYACATDLVTGLFNH